MRRVRPACERRVMAHTTTHLLELNAATERPVGRALLPNGIGRTFVGWLARGGDRLAWNHLNRRIAGTDPLERKNNRP